MVVPTEWYHQSMNGTGFNVDQQELASICERNDISLLAVFGSRARGEGRPDSDLDVFVRFTEPKSLFELMDLEDQLTNVFGGTKTDVVTEGFLSPFIRENVKRDMKVMYGT